MKKALALITSFILTLGLITPAQAVIDPYVFATGGAAGGYDIVNASYDSKSLDVDTPLSLTLAYGIAWDDTGAAIIVGGTNTDGMFEMDCSTNWDISTCTYNSVWYDVGTNLGESNPYSPEWGNSGSNLFFVAGTGAVYNLSCTTAYDLSTCSDASDTYDATEPGTTYGFAFNGDGTKFYLVDTATDIVYQYSITAWDVSTASYDSKSLDLTSIASGAREIEWNGDGTKVFFVANGDDKVHGLNCSAAYDISTCSSNSTSFSVATQTANPIGFKFADSGNKMYVTTWTNPDTVYQYTTE